MLEGVFGLGEPPTFATMSPARSGGRSAPWLGKGAWGLDRFLSAPTVTRLCPPYVAVRANMESGA